ncbi:hypothetical protein FIBSPDRAFT_900342 [Athelia psychrophila]|uniref:Uncharacterized protein n=1 Tax=Athelia psychrophila TaxID=1759441 RepID=A0A165YKV6_9AGAM|nr:hypothetical protein FIBSPDRAFT_900342 [Fibularhizoctonia sp. CBS 109695]
MYQGLYFFILRRKHCPHDAGCLTRPLLERQHILGRSDTHNVQYQEPRIIIHVRERERLEDGNHKHRCDGTGAELAQHKLGHNNILGTGVLGVYQATSCFRITLTVTVLALLLPGSQQCHFLKTRVKASCSATRTMADTWYNQCVLFSIKVLDHMKMGEKEGPSFELLEDGQIGDEKNYEHNYKSQVITEYMLLCTSGETSSKKLCAFHRGHPRQAQTHCARDKKRKQEELVVGRRRWEEAMGLFFTLEECTLPGVLGIQVVYISAAKYFLTEMLGLYPYVPV